MRRNSGIGCGLSLVFLVAFVACCVVIFVAHYNISYDIIGWQVRGQVSSEPNDMHLYMSNVKAGLEKWGMTTGHADPFLPKPDNDMALIYRTVNQQVEQSLVLTTMDRRSPEYQTGLDNLRGSIRELNVQAHHYWSLHIGLIFWLGFLPFGILAFVLCVYTFAMLSENN